ncbi:hypothetical protein OAO40_00490 [Amylibacter sp.]|nr:hypothetical protein [Amylibacter sp.]
MKKLHESNALIVGLARDCEEGIKSTLPRLDDFKNTFKSVQFRIMTNDSSDKTEEVLDNWAVKKENVKIIKQNNLSIHAPKRTARLAICRNMLLDELKDINKYINIDYFIMMDLDGMNSGLIKNQEFTKVVESAPKGWGALTANQRGPYYDIWALRHKKWCPNDCFAEARKYRLNIFNIIKHGGIGKADKVAFKKYISDRQIIICPTDEPIKVNSAYGGFGIYKTIFLKDASFLGLRPNGREVVEIVHFNHQIEKNGGDLYILPNLINDPHW